MEQILLATLGEPRRMQIFELLCGGPLPVGKIANRLKLDQPLVSKHLRVLREVGLVESRALAQQRIYRVQAKPLRQLDKWLESYRYVWDER